MALMKIIVIIMVKITIISDLHGEEPELDGGDLLIIAGDLTACNLGFQYLRFLEWLSNQKYEKKIIVAGNHDGLIEGGRWHFCSPEQYFPEKGIEYLCDSGTEFKGLKIWGSPWTAWFHGVNPDCKAFMIKEVVLENKFSNIPIDTDILITHSPPLGILDESRYGRVGSKALMKAVSRIKPKLHCFGHIHEGYGTYQSENVKYEPTLFVNGSIMNADYEPVNKPINIVL